MIFSYFAQRYVVLRTAFFRPPYCCLKYTIAGTPTTVGKSYAINSGSVCTLFTKKAVRVAMYAPLMRPIWQRIQAFPRIVFRPVNKATSYRNRLMSEIAKQSISTSTEPFSVPNRTAVCQTVSPNATPLTTSSPQSRGCPTVAGARMN